MPKKYANWSEEEYKKHFRNAMSNYAPVLALGESDIGNEIWQADEGLSFPQSPADIFDYLGNIDLLELSETDKEWARESTAKLIEEHGAKWVWDNKFRLKLELLYLKDF